MAGPSTEEAERGTKCARCGDPVIGKKHWISKGSQYNYCDECCEEFENVKEGGVTVRSRHGNREFRRFPYEAPQINGEDPKNQTEALAAGLKVMREEDVRGLFIYQKTGSYWLIDEYLDAHPSIAEDVEKLLASSGRSKSLTDYLPF